MYKEVRAKFKALISKRRTSVAVSAILVISVALLFVFQFNSPERSVANYCAVYREENAKLASADGDIYGVRVFSHKSSDPDDFVVAFSNLEQVAPDEIRSDARILRKVFETIQRDPAQAANASLGGLSAESSVQNWTKKNCPDNI